MAAGGAYSRQASSPVFGGATGEMPDFPSLPLASCFAAGMTALSACAALIARERDGGLGQRIEIPLSDALLEGSGILTTRVEKQAPMRGGVFAPGLYRSRDDQVMCFTSGAFRHLAGLARISGNGAWTEDGTLDWHALRTDPEAPARWRATLVSLFATREADEWEALLRPAGIPIARLRTTREWLREPAAEAAGCVVEQDDGAGRPVRTLRQAVDFEPAAPVPLPAGFAGLPGDAAADRDQGARPVPGGGRPHRHPPADRPRGRGHQGRHRPGRGPLGLRRAAVPRLPEPREEGGDPQPQDAGRPAAVRRPGGRRRHARHQRLGGPAARDGAVRRRAAPAQPGPRLHLPEPLRRHRAVGRLQGLRRDRQLRHRRLIAHGGLGDRPVGRAPGQRPALALHRLHGRRAQRLRGRRRPLRPRPARPHLPGEYQPRPDRPAGADALRRRRGGRGPVPRAGHVLGDLPNLRGRRPARVRRHSRRRPARGAAPPGRRLGRPTSRPGSLPTPPKPPCARSASAGPRPARSKPPPRPWRPTASGRGAACVSSGRRRTSAPSSPRPRSRVSPAPPRWPATPPASSARASPTGGQNRHPPPRPVRCRRFAHGQFT